MGVWAGASGLTSAIGPVLGGWLTQAISWRAVFFINLPVAAVAVWLVLANARESRAARSGPVDWLGAAGGHRGPGAGHLGADRRAEAGRPDPAGLAAAALGVAALAAFVCIERKARQPHDAAGAFPVA